MEKLIVDTSYCPEGFTSEPGHRIQSRDYLGPSLKCYGIRPIKGAKVTEIVLWRDKKMALGEQTEYNIAHNSKIYRVCTAIAYIETGISKGKKYKIIHMADRNILKSLEDFEKKNVVDMLKKL